MEQDHISNSEILCESICKMNFVNISRDTVGQKLANGSFSLVAIPVSAVKSPSDSVRGIKVTEDQYAPFLCCKIVKNYLFGSKKLMANGLIKVDIIMQKNTVRSVVAAAQQSPLKIIFRRTAINYPQSLPLNGKS